MPNKKKLLHQAIYGLEEKCPNHSVRLWLAKSNKTYFYCIIGLLIAMIILAPLQVFLFMFFLLNSLYLVTQISKSFLLYIGIVHNKSEALIVPIELPIYTLLLPIYKEDLVLAKLVASISKIDYPTELLDVKLLIEEDDTQTLEALQNIHLPKFFEIILVPIAYPRTKPKACNYGLQFAKGKYITIYDAEDRPDPQQLKQVVAKFAVSAPEIVCIQAKLNYYNRLENYLTKLFAIEYSILFDYMLIGLQKLSIPIPLGGTSNHFIRSKLEELGGWDAFNVTEDAELGIRLYHQGYRTDLIDSTTLEEAPIDVSSWLIQRARWIKGHMLTSLLYLKQSHKLSLKELLGVVIYLYIPNLVYLLLPIYLLLSCFIIEIGESGIIWHINLLLGIFLPIIYSILIIVMNKWKNMKSVLVFACFYYWLLPIAGIRAFWQIFVSPFHWDKTAHGVSNYAE